MMSLESEIVSNIIEVVIALLQLIISLCRITVAILQDFRVTSWIFSSSSQEHLRTTSNEEAESPPCSLRKKFVAQEDKTQKLEIATGSGSGSGSIDGQQTTDPFWQISTLPTSHYPNIPPEEHAPKYAPDYDTLASLDSNQIFPPSMASSLGSTQSNLPMN